MAVKPIPDGYHTVTPYLIVNKAAEALEFYKQAFGAIEEIRMEVAPGVIAHAEVRIGDSPIMLADEFPDMGCQGPHAYGGSPVSMMIYVEDVDQVFAQAIAAGAKETRPVKDQFYGDRMGTLEDPYGHSWNIATHTEDLTREELDKRHEEFMQQQAGT